MGPGMLDKITPVSPTDGLEARNRTRGYPESHDEYSRVVARADSSTRVIECPAGIQWIVQRLKISNGQRVWAGRSFCQTREALIRCVREWVPGEHPVLQALPERFPELDAKGRPNSKKVPVPRASKPTPKLDPRIVPDSRWPNMFRLRYPDGSLSDMVNLTRAKDALRVMLGGWR
jgi:hypothetical protein